MKSMIILTDFSEAAFRAGEYACELAGCLNTKQIVLYHAYQAVFAGTPDVAAIAGDEQQAYLESMEGLGMLHDRLKSRVEPGVNLDMVAEETMLAGLGDLLNERCRKEGIGLIVMGVSGKSELDQFFIGSTTTQILKSAEVPVLIVPEDTVLGKGINTVVLTTDLKDVQTIPVRHLYEFLDAIPSKLLVVNVKETSGDRYSPELEKAITDLHKLVEKYDSSFHYISGNDIVEEILDLGKKEHASLIIAVHQQHGFLSGIFHKSITKKLAYNSSIPLLVLPGIKSSAA